VRGVVNGVAEAGSRPPASRLCVGVGARRGVPAADVCASVREVLRGAWLEEETVTRLATVQARAAEPGMRTAAHRLGARLHPCSPAALAAVRVPNPSRAVRRSAGTPSVAEAAALLAAGEGARLLVPKRVCAPGGGPGRVTVAVARGRTTDSEADRDLERETGRPRGALSVPAWAADRPRR
jgi:cobalamin biosynthesis protein CbiG